MHISLYVADLAASESFYSNFFSSPPIKEKPGYMKYELESPNLVISFIQDPQKAGTDFGHLGFRVDSKVEVDAYLKDAVSKGLLTREENNTKCCYARQDKFWVTDPDGNSWEIYHVIEDVDTNDPAYQQSKEAACC